MPRAGPSIRYRSNGVILGKRAEGRKVTDQVTGFWTYDDLLSTSDFGEQVVAGGEGDDYRDDQPNVNIAPGDLPTSQPYNGNVVFSR